MKKIIIFMIAVLSVFSAWSQENRIDTLSMTLEDCLDYAFGYNYSRQSMKLNEAAKTDLYEQSKMERLPSLSASLNESLSHTKGNSSSWDGNYGLNANLTLFQGGKITNTIKKDKLTSEKAVYESRQYDNELTIKILQSFLSVIGNEELLRLQEALLVASEEQVRQGELRYATGQILESDLLLLQAQLTSDKKDILESKITKENSLMTLKSLLSMDPLQPFKIVFPDEEAIERLSLIPAEKEYLDRAMTTLPDLQIEKYAVDIAKASVAISKSGYYPTLSMNAGISTGHYNGYSNFGDQLSNRLNEQVGLTLSIPIFDNKRTRSSVNQSRFVLQQAEYSQKQAELDVKQNAIQEYRNVISAESKYKASTIKEQAYLQSYEAYKVKFNEGAITPVELLQQQNNYVSAMNEYIQDKYSFMLNRKVLDVYMGEKIEM